MRYGMILPLTFALLCTSSLGFAADDHMLKAPAAAPAATPAPAMGSTLPVARDGEVIDSVGGGAIAPVLPKEHDANGVKYLTGGVGDESLAEIKEHAKEYNVRLLISATDGAYMSELKLRFTDKTGKEVLSVDGAGPFFFTNLPAGVYNVEATSMKGVVKTAKITAPAKIPAAGNISIRFPDTKPAAGAATK